VKRALAHDLASAHSQLVALGDEEVHAILSGDLDGVRNLRNSLANARERRERAMAAIREHITVHGC
jgi:hypothetical protein